jgi:hypothetical protein
MRYFFVWGCYKKVAKRTNVQECDATEVEQEYYCRDND